MAIGPCLDNDAQPACGVHLPSQGDCWVGISDPQGEWNCSVCIHGGVPCSDSPDMLQYKYVLGQMGRRWLLPHPSEFSRAADGMFHDLRSGVPLPVLSAYPSTYLRGSCYESPPGDGRGSGIECHGYDTCFCIPRPDMVGGIDDPCEGGALVGELVLGRHPDVFAYYGVADSNPFCKKYWDRTWAADQVVALRGRNGLHAPPLLRSGGDWDCIADPMVLCASQVISSQNECSYYQERLRGEEDPPYFYNNNGTSRRIFDTMDIGGAPRIRMDAGSSPPERAAVTERNRVLEHVMGGEFPNADSVESTTFDALDRKNYVAESIYGRSWNYPPGARHPIEALPVIETYPNCYLRNAGTVIPLELRLCAMTIDLALDIIQGQWHGSWGTEYTSPEYRRRHPHVRMRILAQCFWTAPHVPPAIVLERPWYPEGDPRRSIDVGVFNPTESDIYTGGLPGINNAEQRWPHVTASQPLPFLDELVFVDANGVEFEPFNDVLWMGYLGQFSDPGTSHLEKPWPYPDGPIPPWANCCENYWGGTVSFCKQLAAHFHNIEVGGWPYVSPLSPSRVGDLPDPPDKLHNNAVYDGSVMLSFRNSNYRLAGCGDC